MDGFYDVGDRLASGNTISKRAGCRSGHGLAGLERERRGRRVHRAYADDLGLQSEQIPHGDESTDSGAHTDTDIHRIEPLNRAKQLQRVARNASDEIPVEGGNEVQVLSGGDAMCLVLGFVEILSELDYSGTERANRSVLIRRVSVRHVDSRRNAGARGRERD